VIGQETHKGSYREAGGRLGADVDSGTHARQDIHYYPPRSKCHTYIW